MSGLDYERRHMTHRCIQAHLGKIRRESELSPACSGASQSPERGRICGHCPATAFHCNQSGAQGNDESPSEGSLPRLIVAGLSCAVPQHSALLSAHTHTHINKNRCIQYALSGPGHVWKSLQSSRLLSPF